MAHVLNNINYYRRCFECGFDVTINGPTTGNMLAQPYMTRGTRLAYEAGVAAGEEVKLERIRLERRTKP